MLRFFTNVDNPKQSFADQLFAAIKNIGPDFFSVYSHDKIPVSKNIWILISIINDDNQQSKINAVIQLINHTMTKRDQEYLKSKGFPLQHNGVENVRFYSQYINPVVFYLMSKNSTLYNNLEAKTLLSFIHDLDKVKFDVVKKYIRKFLDISTVEGSLDFGLEQVLSQKRTIAYVTDQAKINPSFASRYNAILLYKEFIRLLASVDRELENLKKTYFSIPESRELIADFNQRFLKLVEQRDKNYSSIYDLKVTCEELDKLCMNFQYHNTETTNLFEEIKGYRFSKDQLIQEIQKQKKSFRKLIPQVKIQVNQMKPEKEKNVEQRPDREKLEDELRDKGKKILEEQKCSLVEETLWVWYSEYAMNYVEIKLSVESPYEVLVDAYKENQLMLKKLSELRDFFKKLQLAESQEQVIQLQMRAKLLGLLSEMMRNKIILIKSIIEPLLQILSYAKEKYEHLNSLRGTVNLVVESKHLNLFMGIVNLVIETAEMWLGNVRDKNVLSLSEGDIYGGINNVNRLDEVKNKLSMFLINSELWGILEKLHALENDLGSKKKEKENLQIEIENNDKDKKSEFIKVLDDFEKGIRQKIPQYKRNIRTGCGESVMVEIARLTERQNLNKQILEVLNRLNNVKQQKISFIQWIQEIQALLKSPEDFGELNELLQHQLSTLRKCCNVFKNEFDAYLKATKQKLEEFNNGISKLERQQQEIQDTVKTMILNLDKKAKLLDFGLREEKKDDDDDHEVKVLSETLELLVKLDQCIPKIDEMLDNLLRNEASGAEKCFNDVATLKASRKKCNAVLECANLPSGVLDCLHDYLSMSIKAVEALSEKMVSLGDDASRQQEGLSQNFSI